MHPTAMLNAKMFFDVYGASFETATVADIGAQDVNGSLRSICPERMTYVGVDFVAGKGVDIVLDDPYRLPFADASVDIVVSSSCFEHSEMFWLLFLEIMRILKEPGLFYLNAPSNGEFHRYPVDCWRFYPDCGAALATWGRRNSFDTQLMESYVAKQIGDVWNDYVAIFVKGTKYAARFSNRITNGFEHYVNGMVFDRSGILKMQRYPEDMAKLIFISNLINNKVVVGG